MLEVDESKKASLSLIDNFPVQVQVTIFSNGDGYTAYVSADLGRFHSFRIECTPKDIEELNSEMQSTIEQVARSLDDTDAFRSAFSALAHKGTYAFHRIFTEGIPRETMSKALKVGATVQIATRDFIIPWELLYEASEDTSESGEIDPFRFWGMRYIVSRALIQEARPGDLASPAILSSCPHVGLIVCNELEYVVEKEVPALRRFHRNKQMRLFFLRSLNIHKRDQGLTTFGRFLSKKLHIVHLACHAHEEKPLSQSFLLISDHFNITMEDFGVREFTAKHHPFVILNACVTGTISPLSTSNWAALFWGRGARGVLATEFHVPDSFAAAFAEELYKHFLAGKPIGEALLTVRRYFWEQQQNPLGLAYALYASPSIRIIDTNKKDSAYESTSC